MNIRRQFRFSCLYFFARCDFLEVLFSRWIQANFRPPEAWIDFLDLKKKNDFFYKMNIRSVVCTIFPFFKSNINVFTVAKILAILLHQMWHSLLKTCELTLLYFGWKFSLLFRLFQSFWLLVDSFWSASKSVFWTKF